MPIVSVHIRKDDLASWRALENKSLWIHENLNKPLKVNIGAQDIRTVLVDSVAGQQLLAEPCKGHSAMRFNCGRQGCSFA